MRLLMPQLQFAKKKCALHNKCLNDNKSDLNFNLTDLKPLNTNSPTLVCSDYNIVLSSKQNISSIPNFLILTRGKRKQCRQMPNGCVDTVSFQVHQPELHLTHISPNLFISFYLFPTFRVIFNSCKLVLMPLRAIKSFAQCLKSSFL